MQGTDLRIHDVKEQVAKALPKQKERTIEDAEAVVKAFLSTSPAIEAVAKSNEASKAIRGKLAETSNALLASLGKAK
jgi:predicted metal-binding transcription factor (methanogenesis marker protein 9)